MKRIILSLFLLAGAFTTAPAAQKQPNILILLADDLGARDLGCYFPKTFYETPHLDKLASEGARFTDAYAASPVCSPTRYSIITGKYPTRSGLTNFLTGLNVQKFAPAPLTRALPPAEITLAEALRSAGYHTAFLGKWHLGSSPNTWPDARGFEVNFGGCNRGQPSSYFSPYNNPRLTDGPTGESLTLRLAHETVKLLEQYKADGKPFLICHWFYAVHNPQQVRPEIEAKYIAKAKRLGLKAEFAEDEQFSVHAHGPRRVRLNQTDPKYAAMVETMDTAAGEILDALDRLGLADNTVVLFLSDNGGLSTAEGSPTSNVPLRDGKGWVYEGGIREPMIVRWPGVTKPGSTISTPVISMDFYATSLALAGVSPKPGQIIDGRNLVPLLKEGREPDRDALFWHYPHYSQQGGFPGGAVRIGDWKLIERFEDGRLQLFNLRDDIGEQHDLAAEHPDRVAAMKKRLHAWYQETGAKFLQAGKDGQVPWRPDYLKDEAKPSSTE